MAGGIFVEKNISGKFRQISRKNYAIFLRKNIIFPGKILHDVVTTCPKNGAIFVW